MEQTHIFNRIEEGMDVVQESDKEKIGTVEFVKYGEGEDVEAPEIDTIMELLADIFDPKTDYPDEVYQRLYANGFLVVDRGLKSDVYVMPNQIVHVVDSEVHINVSEDDLLSE